jgi:hypothetical protein
MSARHFAALIVTLCAVFGAGADTMQKLFAIDVDLAISEKMTSKMSFVALVGAPLTWETTLPSAVVLDEEQGSVDAARFTLIVSDSARMTGGEPILDFSVRIELRSRSGRWIMVSQPRVVTEANSPALISQQKEVNGKQVEVLSMKLLGRSLELPVKPDSRKVQPS